MSHSSKSSIPTFLYLDHVLACSALPWLTEAEKSEQLLSQVTLPEVHGTVPEDLAGTPVYSETHRCGIDEPHANIAALCILRHRARCQACPPFRLESRHLS